MWSLERGLVLGQNPAPLSKLCAALDTEDGPGLSSPGTGAG